MSASVLIEAAEAEGFGGGGMVAWAFGDVQVAGEGRHDGGADGGQVGGPAAGSAGCGIFAEGHVADVMVCILARLVFLLPAMTANPCPAPTSAAEPRDRGCQDRYCAPHEHPTRPGGSGQDRV